jgi:hypothetical protein
MLHRWASEQPQLPLSANVVVVDFEGVPACIKGLESIYLWGLQVFGINPEPYVSVIAGSESQGDRNAWAEFLKKSAAILAGHGDIPFVHWHHYERTRIELYRQRYGEIDGIAARVLSNLLDLFPHAG